MIINKGISESGNSYYGNTSAFFADLFAHSESGQSYTGSDLGWINGNGAANYTPMDRISLREVEISGEGPVKPKPVKNNTNKGDGSVGEPGFGESLIPFWGSGRSAVDNYQNGNYWTAAGYGALAISDVFLIKAAATAIGKAAVIGVGKLAAEQGGKELFNFGSTAAKHMANSGRAVPIQILDEAIKSSRGLADPQGSRALMHTVEMWKNGKAYNLEVLYDKATNSIWHFKYK